MSGAPVRAGLIVGSLRRDSYARKIAVGLTGMAPPGLTLTELQIGDLPLYNEDLETDAPASWTRFRDEVRACDALLFVTPEYNRSMPGCVKNAVDVGSRPYGANCFAAMPAAIAGLSSGPLGGVAAVHNLRQSLVTVNVAAMAHPEIYMGNAAGLFASDGALVASTSGLLGKFLAAFLAFSRAHTSIASTA